MEETLTRITQAPVTQEPGEKVLGLDGLTVIALLIIILVFTIILVMDFKRRDLPGSSASR